MVSPTFLLHGYAFRLGSQPNSTFTVYLMLVKGPNDECLPWPCEFSCKFSLMNPKCDRDHYSTKFIHSAEVLRLFSSSKPQDKPIGFGVVFLESIRLKDYTDDAGYITLKLVVMMEKPWRFQ